MSLTSPSNRIVAAVILVDSSITLSTQWSFVFKDYVTKILLKVREAYLPANNSVSKTSFALVCRTYEFQSNFFAGFIVYGPSETRPSPILTKRFFVHAQYMFKEVFQFPGVLGMGQTLRGEGNGFAVLDGFAAAIEVMFSPRMFKCRLIILYLVLRSFQRLLSF
jgi:hypothetical protein